MKPLDAWLPEGLLLESRIPTAGPFARITADSREVIAGTLYFCIRGTQIDGHRFVAEVNAKGAAAVVVEDRAVFESTPNAILVSSCRRAYALACANWFGFPGRGLKTVAVTGTNGKTTTTFLIAELLEQIGWKPGLIGTVVTRTGGSVVESNMTTPDAFHVQKSLSEMVSHGLTSLAVEATSIALDQHRLTGTPIEVAAFTNLTQDHLDYHLDWETYFQAKRALFFDMGPRHCLINADDQWGQRLISELRRGRTADQVTTFSLDAKSDADLVALDLTLDSNETRGTLRWRGQALPFRTTFIGMHNVANVLTAVGSGLALGITLEDLVAGLPKLKGAPGRLERVALPAEAPNVFVDYAHTPDAIEKVAKTLKDVRSPGAKLITVFGAGGDRDRKKRPLMAQAAARFSDILVVTSDNPRTEAPGAIVDDVIAGLTAGSGSVPFHREVDRRKAIGLALSLAKTQDLVLIAGKGHETYQIIGKEKVDFDDKKVAIDAYLTQNRVLR